MHPHPNRALERVFAHLRSQPLDVAHELLSQLRRGTDVHTVLRFIKYGSLPPPAHASPKHDLPVHLPLSR